MPPMPSVALVAVAFFAGAAAGYAWEHRARKAEVAEIRAEIAEREAQAAEESRRRIKAAQSAADYAIAHRDARIAELDATQRRLRHDLKTATTGRACLSADARRLLHQSPAFGLRLPASAGGLAATPAAAATDPASGDREQGSGISTDADVAEWILDAASLYEQCRARIDAIRQWDAAVNGGAHGR